MVLSLIFLIFSNQQTFAQSTLDNAQGESLVLGSGSTGGIDPVENTFYRAKNLLITAFQNYGKVTQKPLSQQTRAIINEYFGQIIAEITGSNFQFDHTTKEPFKETNGSYAPAQTNIRFPLSPIQVRTQPLKQTSRFTDLNAVTIIAHEIGHHFPEIPKLDEEQKAWAFSGAIMEFLMSVIPYPELINVNGD